MSIDLLGKWPVEGSKSRKSPVRIVTIPKEKMLSIIWGKDNPVLLKFIVSNDYVHVAELHLPSGGKDARHSESVKHEGDEVIFVCQGTLCVFLPDTKEAFEVKEEEAMLIPEGIIHQYINYSDQAILAVKVVAPTF